MLHKVTIYCSKKLFIYGLIFPTPINRNFQIENGFSYRSCCSSCSCSSCSCCQAKDGQGVSAHYSRSFIWPLFREVDAKCAAADYPPCGLSAGVRALPQWIQLGCGNSEYICAERGATFSADNPPAQLPDLSNHNSFFAETLRKNPGLWDEYKNKKTSLGVTFGHCIKTGVDNKGEF